MKPAAKIACLLSAIESLAPGAIAQLLPKPKPPRLFTSADAERIAKAEAKRARKSAKLAARTR